MGEATKKDGPALAAAGDTSHDLPLSTSPRLGLNLSWISRGDVVSLRDCLWQHNKFVTTYERIDHCINVMAFMGLREEYETSGKPRASIVNLFREKDPRQVLAIEHEDGSG